VPEAKLIYEIDDAESVDQNLATFCETLNAVDADLAAVLQDELSNISREKNVSRKTLYDALYAATNSADETV
tara:strand:- start:4968 stop:5183 length:216 start_codon:yes stop_codon:yes gene_type:complete